MGLFVSHFVKADEQLRSDFLADITKASEKCHPKSPTTSDMCRDARASTIAITSSQSKYLLICRPALTIYFISNYLLPIEPVNLSGEIGEGRRGAALYLRDEITEE